MCDSTIFRKVFSEIYKRMLLTRLRFCYVGCVLWFAVENNISCIIYSHVLVTCCCCKTISYFYYRPTKTRKISRSLFRSPKELVDHQISELQERIDQLHSRLKDTIKEGLQQDEGEEQSATPLIQTATLELKRRNLLKDIETLTSELEKKRHSQSTY